MLPKQEHLRILSRIAALAMLIGIVISSRLWLGTPAFPQLPLFGAAMPGWIDGGALIALIVCLILITRGGTSRVLSLSTVAAILLLTCGDITRAQPWVYQYLLVFAVYAAVPSAEDESEAAALFDTLRVITAAIYLWSGLQKLNFSFIFLMTPWLAKPLLERFPSLDLLTTAAGAAAPLFEAGLGIALLTKRFHRAAAIGLALMHAVLLVALGPLGRNWNMVVWPWNAAMIMLVLSLFWNGPGVDFKQIRRRPLLMTICILAAAFPALNRPGMWPAYFSWALYSSDDYIAEYILPESELSALPIEIRSAVKSTRPKEGYVAVDPISWSVRAVGVPVPPEPLHFFLLGEFLCGKTAEPRNVRTVIFGRPARRSVKRVSYVFSCRLPEKAPRG